MKKIVYPGTFDPITIGHFDLIERAAKSFDEVIVLVTNSDEKITVCNLETRYNLVEKLCKKLDNVKVEKTSILLTDFLNENNYNYILRGLRTVTDYHYEMQLALTYKMLKSDIEVIFMVTNNNYVNVSSSIVRSVLQLEGDVSKMLNKEILEEVKSKYKKGE